jgi:hypothetical protein
LEHSDELPYIIYFEKNKKKKLLKDLNGLMIKLCILWVFLLFAYNINLYEFITNIEIYLIIIHKITLNNQ